MIDYDISYNKNAGCSYYSLFMKFGPLQGLHIFNYLSRICLEITLKIILHKITLY